LSSSTRVKSARVTRRTCTARTHLYSEDDGLLCHWTNTTTTYDDDEAQGRTMKCDVDYATHDIDAQRRYTTTTHDNARRRRRPTVTSRYDKRQHITTMMTTKCSKMLLL